jgi:hypothetical protein
MKNLASIFAILLVLGFNAQANNPDKGKKNSAVATAPTTTLRTEILSLIEADAQEEVNRTLTFDMAAIDANCITNLIDEDAQNEVNQPLELTSSNKVTGTLSTLFETNALQEINSNLVEKTTIQVDYLQELIEQNTNKVLSL